MAEPAKGISVLYVCPWAHWTGHPPQAITRESSALLKAGAEVSLCTFRGIRDQEGLKEIPHRTVVSSWLGFPLGIITRLLHSLPKGRSLAGFLEQLATLCLAVKLRKSVRYDVIYLRDGDPFVFIPFVLGLVLKDYRWAISLLGMRLVRSPGCSPGFLFYKFINAPVWKPIYRRGFSKNRFVFLCENRYIKDFFETDLLDGILSGKVRVVPPGVEKAADHVLQREARRYLGLPEDKTVFLHFGTLHQGKEVGTVLAAIKDIPDALLVHAGKVTSVNLIESVKRYGLQGQVVIKDYYIPEAEKQYYFAAADAIILSYKKDFTQTASMLWEAARFQLPAIANDVGELGELVERYQIGLVFKAENATSLKKALSHFLTSSRSEKETMRNNCKKFCDAFSLNNWAQQYAKIFIELCRPKRNKA